MRLAERQGLLRGPRLSPVQHRALTILDVVDYVEDLKRKDRELRIGLLHSVWEPDPEKLFEELQDVETDDAADIPESTDLHGEAIAVKYDFSNVDHVPTQEEVEEQIRRMLAQAS